MSFRRTPSGAGMTLSKSCHNMSLGPLYVWDLYLQNWLPRKKQYSTKRQSGLESKKGSSFGPLTTQTAVKRSHRSLFFKVDSKTDYLQSGAQLKLKN